MILFSAEKLFFNSPSSLFEIPTQIFQNDQCLSNLQSSYCDSSSVFSKELNQQTDSISQQLKTAIDSPTPQDMQSLATTNQRLQAQGRPLVDFSQVSRQVESVMNRSDLSPKEKKQRLETLRKQLGLSKGEMKKLFTKRIEGLYRKATRTLKTLQQQKTAMLNREKSEIEARFGKNSPQALEVQKKIETLNNHLAPKIRNYQEKAAAYRALYPSFWSKVGGFFKKIGKGFLKVVALVKPLIKLIPGIGPFAGIALEKTIGLMAKIIPQSKKLISNIPLLSKLF